MIVAGGKLEQKSGLMRPQWCADCRKFQWGWTMKTLFAVDGSKQAILAALSAVRFLRLPEVEADVVCVTPEYLSAMTGWDEGKMRERYRRRIQPEAHRIVCEASKALQKAGLQTRTMLEMGPPGGVLVRLAANYDLVVVGAKGTQDPRDLGLGPVASHVAQHAPSSVLIGRESRGANGFRVLAAVDGSAASRHAVAELASLIKLDSAEVTLMHVIETPWLHLGLEQEWFGYEERAKEEIDPAVTWQKRLQDEAVRVVENARDQLLPQHAALERKITEGTPGNEILSEAEQGDYDLVVAGATGASDLKHQLLGSVSSKLAWHAPCSVLIVKSPE